MKKELLDIEKALVYYTENIARSFETKRTICSFQIINSMIDIFLVSGNITAAKLLARSSVRLYDIFSRKTNSKPLRKIFNKEYDNLLTWANN